MAPPTKREQELERQMAELKGMLAVLTQTQGRPTSSGKPVVGIRNISSYTIGLVNRVPGEEGELQLDAAHFDQDNNPGCRAIISDTYWQTLKRGREVRRGQIVRDDTFVTSGNVGAPDLPEDLPAEHYVNAIEDPFAWIEGHDEDALQGAIQRITSEPTLRRLQAAVTHRIRTIGEEQFEDDPERGKKALRALPSKYHRVDQLVLERLDEFMPNHSNYANERQVTARL